MPYGVSLYFVIIQFFERYPLRVGMVNLWLSYEEGRVKIG